LLASEPDTGVKRPSFRRVLSNRSVLLLWIATSISQSGDYVFNVALVWYVLASTGSVFDVGITQAVVNIPPALIAPIAGVYADRFNRRNVMIWSALFQGGITAITAIAYISKSLTFLPLMVLLFLLFSGAQFFIAAINAYIPRAVDPEDLASANSLFSLSSMSNKLVGYSVGALLFLIAGVFIPIVYDSFSFFAATALLLLVSSSIGVALKSNNSVRREGIAFEPKQLSSASPPSSSFLRDLKQGIGYFKKDRALYNLIFVGFILTYFSGGLVSLLAPYAELELRGDSLIYGALLVAAVIGGAIGAYIFGKINSRKYLGIIFTICVTSSGVAAAIMGLLPNLPIALGFGMLLGGSYFVANLAVQVIIQARVPSTLVARVYTVFFGILAIAAPIASFLSGLLADYVTVATIYTVYGICVSITGIMILMSFREIVKLKY
jgi:DHA3 family macrolide efflux protein-like MFS transporter